jgi:hypothetical protein
MIGVVHDKPVSPEQSSRNGLLVGYIKVCKSNTLQADPSGRAIYGVGPWQLACWDCGFESRRGHGCLSLVSVVCCQVEVSSSR